MLMSENSENTQSPKYKQLLDELAEKFQNKRSVQGRYRIVSNPDNWVVPEDLAEIIGISSELLTNQARATLDIHEQKSKGETEFRDWIDFKWKLTAFYEIQDIFDAPFYAGNESFLNLFHLWYFYFESRHLLTESILCGLQGLYASSNAMLRLFLEFNILQLYYYQLSNQAQNYKALENYFRSGNHPSWNTALKKAVPDDSFCRPIKMLLDLQLKSLSRSAAHAYHPNFSPRHYSNSVAEISLEGIFFWQLIRMILRPVLWAYYVNFPMLFHPRDLLKKFGFNSPTGLYIDKQCAIAVKRSLHDDEYQEFLEYSQSNNDVKSLIVYYEEQPDKTEQEIKESWNPENLGELERIFPQGYAKQMAHMRALREFMALKTPDFKDVPQKAIDDFRFLSYSQWKKLYKRASK